MSTSLIKLSAARTALAEARSLNDVVDIRDQAKAVSEYVKAIGESLEIQNQAADIRLCAERKAGEMLAGMEKHNGGRPSKETGDIVSPVSLTDLGITKKQSSRWQLAAKLPENEYVALVTKISDASGELTQAAVLRTAKRHVYGESEKKPAPEPCEKAALFELLGIARSQIADLAELFGEEHAQALRGVLLDEAALLEERINGDH